ncbi:non-ribosomal peptide synthetase [Penicillium cosmopolitanum]|uniref:Non-ribosomal peptide synthetase n=1 Tax=Penicillium cosmopolitanum TaxID=1131564 RepID=A0A9W9WBE6_9EURO|nr:non-ribosomal peptide synthetase [Penicillium cosmopolitanum]KAJ5414300.1 non-ribosomal peptide synthetase [Penicillium cosmopolitanum]
MEDTHFTKDAELVSSLTENKKLTTSIIESEEKMKFEMTDIWTLNATLPETVHECVQDLISQRATVEPNAPALYASNGKTLTYHDLEAFSDSFAHSLSQIIGPGSLVPLCFEKSIWTAVAMLAVLKSGNAFTFLDVSQPEVRLLSIVQQTRAKVVLCSVGHQDLGLSLMNLKDGNCDNVAATRLYSDIDVLIVAPRRTAEISTAGNHQEQTHQPKPESTCYVVFTSGSTGTPKGAVISHSSICSAIHYQLNQLGFSSNSRVFDFASHSFDVAVHNMLATLVSGGCLCIPTEEERIQDPAGAIAAMEVTLANLTPSVARLIDPARVPSLKTLIFLGETLTQAEAKRWETSSTKPRIINTYGPAECTPISTIDLSMEFRDDTKNMEIGFGVGVLCWVVEPENHDILLSPGKVGELLLEGPVVSEGYLFEPEKTAKAFISSPLWLRQHRPSSRLYATGDLVQHNEDGSLRFMGRKDTQVKIHGQRVELGEIEYHVQSCFPSAVQTVVDSVPSATGKSLVAFLQVASSQEEVAEMKITRPCETLTSELSCRLPNFMVPQIYILVPSIPRTPSGKTDRKGLRESGTRLLNSQPHHSSIGTELEPRSEAEQTVQLLCGIVLQKGPESIELDHSFLTIGGDSLMAIQLVGEARKEGIQLRVVDVMNPKITLRELGRLVIPVTDQDAPAVPPPFSLTEHHDFEDIQEIARICDIDPSSIEDVYPCTPLQEGLFALAMQRPGDYILQTTLSLDGLKGEAVQRSLEKLYNETPILRTRIVQNKPGGLAQVVINHEENSIQWTRRTDLQEYLEMDRSDPMETGRALTRFALIGDADDASASKWIAITLHHALYDAWSLDLMLKRLEALYLRELGHSSPVLPSKSQFNSFLRYVGEPRSVSIANEYWRKTLDHTESVQFPALRKNEQSPVQKTSTMEFHCQLQDSARSSQATLSTIIRGALAIVISRHTQSSDITFGATVSGRHALVTGIEEIVGPTIATIPIRVQLDDIETTTVLELLQHLQNQATQMIPFEQIGLQNIAKLSESARQACDFQTLLVIQPEERQDRQQSKMSWYTETEQLSTYALTLECFIRLDSSIQVRARYNPAALDAWHLKMILEQLSGTIKQLVDVNSASRPLQEIDLLPAHQKSLISKWNGTVPTGVDRFIHELIREQVTQQPERPAISAWDGTFSYRELHEYTENLAAHLQSLGVQKGSLVPICFEKSLFAVISMLAVLKAGAGFVPIEPSLPPGRRQNILEDTSAQLVIASLQHANIFHESFDGHVFVLSWDVLETSMSNHGHGLKSQYSNDTAPSSSVAYVIFTSGTTGRPKGVVVEHKAASSSCTAHGRALGFSPTSRVLQFSSYAFDACIAEIFTTLIFGGCICIPSDSDRLSRLPEAINSLGVNWVFLTPAVARLIEPTAVTCVKTITIGGEKFSSTDAERWSCDGRRVILVYGPTECCVYCSGHDLEDGVDSRFIGVPFGCVVWVADPNDHNQLAPLGSIGELLIEGPILSRGYLNAPDKSKESFVTDPAWLVERGRQARLYKTGDLVQYSPRSCEDGSRLRYVGRKDTQVKIRGQRLELAEVEHHVKQCIAAKQVVTEVVNPGDTKSSELLVAFIEMPVRALSISNRVQEEVLENNDNVSATIFSPSPDMEQQIVQKLPKYMVPELYFAMTGSIPRMVSSGKTDRKLLRQLGATLVQHHRATTEDSECKKRAPSSEDEHRLQRLWMRVLNIPNEEQIGIDDSFFQLGGDSIMAMKLVAESRKDMLTLTVADVMRCSTIAAQAQLQGQLSLSSNSSHDYQVEPFSLISSEVHMESLASELRLPSGAGIQDVYPCSPLQEGIMALASKNPGDYVLQNVLELSADVKIVSFKKAWEETLRLTPILQTRIVSHHGLGLLQVVQPEKIDWVYRDNEDVEAYLQESKLAPMGLGQQLSRFALLGSPSQPRYCVWTLHHSLYDGWTLPLITDLASSIYSGESFTPQRAQFKNFIKYIEQNKGAETNAYWQHTLDNHEGSPFPPLPPHVREPVADMMREQDISLLATKSSDISTSALLRAALALVMSRHTSSPDIVFGATMSGRNAPIPGIASIAGPTIATVPIRMKGLSSSSATTVSRWLRDVQQQANGMIPFEQTGLQNIARLSPSCQSACQFQTLLVIQADSQTLASSQKSAFGTWQTAEDQSGFTTYALTLEYLPPTRPSEMGRFRARFDSRVISCWAVEKLLAQWEYAANQLAAAAIRDTDHEMGTLLADLDLLPSQDRAVLSEWNISSPPPSVIERCVHAMITDQAQARPTEFAIEGWDGKLTYQELNISADRLAEHLIDLGVGPEVLVPLCFPKSSWTIVAILGVLKAGGAFVLLDPTHPTERLCMLCEKSRATVAVASSSSTSDRIRPFVETVIIVDKGITRRHWNAPTMIPASPNISPPNSASPSSSFSMQMVSPSNTAYVIFTSGSTGAPKGCKIEHRSYCSAAVNHGSVLQMSPQLRTLQFGSYSFAGAIMEILMTLIHGGCVCVPTEEERNPSLLGNAIQRLNANWAFLTSTVLSSLRPEMVSCLKTVCVGGEAVHAAQITQWSNKVHLRQTYGSAETSAVVSSARLTQDAATGDVGKPTTGRYWIVDPTNVDRLAPLGAVGEVLIEGPTIGREYLDEPEKSAAAFIQVPSWRTDIFGGATTVSKFYKTGDLGSYTQDGAIKLWGRRDTQVKLRGQRIEIGEIEHQARLASDVVKEVAVEIGIPKSGDGKITPILVAFFVLQAKCESEKEGRTIMTIVRQRLQDTLPQYMVPSAFLVLSEMPKTISRKTDRRALRELAASYKREELLTLGACDDEPKRPPTAGKERMMQTVWSHVLAIDPTRIGADDDFFQLGGDSVSALKLVAESRRVGLVLSISDIFTKRILASLASTAETAPSAKNISIEKFSLLENSKFNDATELRGELAASCGVKSVQIDDAYPCTPLQEGLLSLTLKQPGDYVLQNVLELSDKLKLEDFRAAWQQTVSAVSILRTRILQHNGLGPVQVVINEEIDWRRTSEDLNSFLSQDKIQPMDFGLPLSRFTLVGDQNGDIRWFVWTVHHALYDGWSLPLIIDMITDTYLSRATPSRNELAPFVKYLQETKSEEAQQYWGSALANYESVAFPMLATPSQMPTASCAIERTAYLPQTKIDSQVPLATLIRAALGITINRQTRTNDIIFGAVLSGRNASVPGIEAIIGPTITTVPIRVQFPNDQCVGEYLNGLKQQSIDMIPFEQTGLQDIAKISPSACEFQTLLVIHPAEQRQDSTQNDALGTWLTDADQNGFTTYALTLEVFLPATGESDLRIRACFDESFIGEWETSQLLDQFFIVLQQLVDATPQKIVSDIAVMTAKDQAKIWSSNQFVPQSVDRCVHDLFRERTAIQPHEIALSAWDGEATYEELDILSDRLATCLVAHDGYHIGAIIPLCFEKSMWTVVAMLGCMKSGLTAVTMDITQPVERLQLIVQQIGSPPFMLSSVQAEALASELLSADSVTLVGPNLKKLASSHSSQLPLVDPSTPVCVVFTSGSTGVPKGPALTHTGFASAIHHQAKTFGHGPGARVFNFASYSFDICWFDILHGLASGSTLCIPSETERKDDLEATIARSGATVLFVTPSVARMLRPSAIPSLRLLALGGEPQRWDDFRHWPDRVTKLSVYGPAEDPIEPYRLVPLGAVGEIWLEGPLVGAGYIGDEEKTAAAFIEDPDWLLEGGGQACIPGRRGRLYRTGDMARYSSDGHLFFMGRKDTQVKIRGQRVELAEVEHHVHRVMLGSGRQVVAEIITMASERNDASPMLVAFVERETSEDAENEMDGRDELNMKLVSIESKIINELLNKLPSYMVPRVYFSVLSIPRTVNGKTDRKLLRQMGSQFSIQQLAELNARTEQTKPQPTTSAELCLQRLWAQTLNLPEERVGIDDNFFQLGGDSISAMRLVGLARTEGIPSLTVAEVFRLPSLCELARLHVPVKSVDLEKDQPVTPFSLLPRSIDPEIICKELSSSFGISHHVQDLYPCTPLQEGLLALTSKNAGNYVMQSVLELPQSADFQLGAFKSAWDEIFRATDILRTRIVEHHQLGLAQIVTTYNGIEWLESRTENLEAYLREDKLVSMGFGQPLTRFALVGSQEATRGPKWFVWTVHHALYDGWSLPIVTEKAATIYRRLISSAYQFEDSPPVAKFSAFVKYVQSQKTDVNLRSYWELACTCGEDITAYPPLPASVCQPMTDQTLEQACPLASSVQRSITISTLVRAALALLISRRTGATDAIFGAIVSGRNSPIPGIEHIEGPTIATVPLQIPVPEMCKVGDYLAQVQQQATEMIPFEQTGLRAIAMVSEQARRVCEFQTLLVVQSPDQSVEGETQKDYGTWRTDANQQGFTTYALTIECFPMKDQPGMTFRATFDSRVIDTWLVERLLVQLSFLVQQLDMVDPESTLAEVETLPCEDEEMIWNWNKSVPEKIDRCIYEQPNAPAVCAWDGDFSYHQLNDLAERLAFTLLAVGVTPGQIVPLCFEKSKWTVVGVLGVLKAGAAFVFLDAETQPEARLRAITHQANASVICSSLAHQSLSRSFGAAVVVVGPESLTAVPTPLPRVDPANPLYLNFTSGSTGQPKGAIVPHRSFASALHHQLGPLNINRGTRLYDFASYSFDVAIHNVLATLSAGGCLCVPSDMDRKTRLPESMEEMRTNYVDLTASVSRLLDPRDVPSLRTLTLGGEPVSQDDAERWWGNIELINSCGPSECTPMSVINAEPSSPTALRRIGLGKGMLTWIVDPTNHHQLLPVGQVGELVLEGPLLGAGYLNDPIRTEATFIEPPQWLASRRSSPTRVYKTGDLVQYCADGSLHIVGRKDTQVKVRGQRVELEEVEHHLRLLLPQDAKVTAEAVVMEPSATLIAFICLDSQSTSSNAQVSDNQMPKIAAMASDLAEKMSHPLPPYMVPSLYVPLVAMPMTATGKTNRKELRALASSLSREQLDLMRGLPTTKQPRRQPVTPLEHHLQSLWARILHMPQEIVGLDDNFIALGGDSITAMQVVGGARKQGLKFSVADIFQQRTIAALIVNCVSDVEEEADLIYKPYSLLDDADRQGILSTILLPENVEDILPMTDFQVQSVKQPCNYFYLDIGTVKVDEGLLRTSCELLSQHYPLLRSTFVSFEKNYFTIVRQQGPPAFAIVDTKSSLDKACTAICEQDSRRGLSPNELHTKFILVRSHPDTQETELSRLIVRLSHAQYDGLSLASMLQTLADVYDGKVQHPRISSPNSSFPPYLAHLISQRDQSRLHWTRRMTGSSNTPVSSSLSNNQPSSSPSKSQTFHKIQAEENVTLPKQNFDHVPHSALISSAWAILLSCMTGHNDVVFGHLVAGRENPHAAHDVIGPCVNIIPVRVQVPPKDKMTASSIREIPKMIHDQLLSLEETGFMMGWQNIIRSCTDWHDESTGSSLFLESFVQHQNINENPEISFAGNSAKLHWYENPDALATLPLGIVSHPSAGGLRIRVLGSSELLTAQLAGSLVSRLCQIVKILVSEGCDEAGSLIWDAIGP